MEVEDLKILNEMHQKMELQLHQQYAENNNANLGSIITLIVTLLAVFYGYGYVYLHSTLEFSDGFDFLCECECKHFTLDALLFTASAVYVVLGIIYYICFSQGLHQRMEQFITFAIRAKYYKKTKTDVAPDGDSFPESLMDPSYHEIFPKGYHPFKKCSKRKRNCFFRCDCECIFKRVREGKRIMAGSDYCGNGEKLAQGLFGDLLPIIRSVAVLVTASLLVKLCANLCHFCRLGEVSWTGVIALGFLSLVVIFVLLRLRWQKICLVAKYINRTKEYERKLS